MSLACFLDEAERDQPSLLVSEHESPFHRRSTLGGIPLSALSLAAFYDAPDELAQQSLGLGPPKSSDTLSSVDAPPSADEPTPRVGIAGHDAVQVLRDLCAKVLGTEDAMSFNFSSQGGTQHVWTCTLAIRRPDGIHRSWSSAPGLIMKKMEAKASAARAAYDGGAAHFINGEQWVPAHPEVVDAIQEDKKIGEPQDEDNEYSMEIASCCMLWRKGHVTPEYILTVNQAENAFGCALRIQLAPHVSRVCSVDILYDSRREAKAAVAQLAVMKTDMLEYIRHGNGQKTPGSQLPTPAPAREQLRKETTVREFYDSLPVKEPPQVGFEDMVAGGSAITWLNQALMLVKGSRLASTWTYIGDSRIALHGAFLTLTHPNYAQRCYLVDPVFSKRQDAKQACCLLALSQGLAEYLKQLSAEVDQRLTPEMKKRAAEAAQALAAEYGKVFRDGKGKPRPVPWEYHEDAHGHGCSLHIEMPDGRRASYRVLLEYRTKTDARMACVLKAVQEGALDVLAAPRQPGPSQWIVCEDGEMLGVLPERRSVDRRREQHYQQYAAPALPWDRDWQRSGSAASRRGGAEHGWLAPSRPSPYPHYTAQKGFEARRVPSPPRGEGARRYSGPDDVRFRYQQHNQHGLPARPDWSAKRPTDDAQGGDNKRART